MLISYTFFTTKITECSYNRQRHLTVFFFWTIMNHYSCWFPCLVLAIFEQFSVYQRLNQVLNRGCPQRSALSTRFFCNLVSGTYTYSRVWERYRWKGYGCQGPESWNGVKVSFEGLSYTPLSKFSLSVPPVPRVSDSGNKWTEWNFNLFDSSWQETKKVNCKLIHLQSKTKAI